MITYKTISEMKQEKANRRSIDVRVAEFNHAQKLKATPKLVENEIKALVKRVLIDAGKPVNDGTIDGYYKVLYPAGVPNEAQDLNTVRARLPLLESVRPAEQANEALQGGANPKVNAAFDGYLKTTGYKWEDTSAQTRLMLWNRFRDSASQVETDRARLLREFSATYGGDLTKLSVIDKLRLSDVSDSRKKAPGYHEPHWDSDDFGENIQDVPVKKQDAA